MWFNKFGTNISLLLHLPDKELPAINLHMKEESRNTLWEKTKLAFAYVYENYK